MAEGERMATEAQRAPTPEEFLESLHADFSSNAASKEAEANNLEDRMLVLRAEAAGLRHAAVGVREALDSYHREIARAKEFMHARDELDAPKAPVQPVNYGDVRHPAERTIRIPPEYR